MTADVGEGGAAPGSRLPGLQGRLYAAFLGICVLVTLMAVVSIISFYRVDRALAGITEKSVPLVVAAMDLSRQAERIVAAAPALLQSTSVDEQMARSEKLSIDLGVLNASLQNLSKHDLDPATVSSIRRSIDQLSQTLNALNRVVTARLAINAQKKQQLAMAIEAGSTLSQILDAWARHIEEAPAVRGVDRTDGAARQLRLRDARQDLALLMSQFAEIGNSDSNERTETLVLQANWSLDRLRRLAPSLSEAHPQSFQTPLDRLADMLAGGIGMPTTRQVELQMIAAGVKSLEESTDLSSRFASAVDRLVGAAQDNIVSANADAKSTQRITAWILLTVVAVILLGSFLIVWLYVQRNVIARLKALSTSMLAIAAGRLDEPVPSVGHDEIGQMAQALSVFRATAIEVRASNMREIQAARRRLDDAIASIQDGLALFDAQDRLVLSNGKYAELLFEHLSVPVPGTSYESILRDALARQLVTDIHIPHETWVAERLSQHRASAGSHVQRLSSGKWIRIAEHKTEDGGTVATYSDITELKQHEMELDGLVAKLRAANEAKSSFIANVSHELRTPLTAILGFARIVQKRLESVIFPRLIVDGPHVERARQQVRQNVEIMLVEGVRLTKMVNDVLDLEKIEAGEMVWNIAPMQVESVLAQAVAATASLYQEKGLTMLLEVEPGLSDVAGDRDRVVQVLVNLISNAVKFTTSGGVSCQARAQGDALVVISVTDTGRGISPEDQPTVFDKFRQVGDTLTDKPSGTGLGLPICREIITRLGGTIDFSSEAGRGSCFRFTLPVAPLAVTIQAF